MMLGGGALVGRASAQVPSLPAEPAPGVSLALRVDALFKEGRHRESLDLLRPHLGHAPSDYTAWVLAGRAALVLGYGASEPDSTKAWLHRAMAWGDSARALDPRGEDGRYVTLAATGRLALVEGQLEQARLAKDIEREALELLAIDSLHAGAHNALGRLYFEIARLPRIKRFVARPWLGGDLIGRASWTSAERHLRRAVELQPKRNFHHVDLGRLLLVRGRRDDARRELRKALDVPLETPEQEGFREEARRLLDKLGSQVGQGSGP